MKYDAKFCMTLDKTALKKSSCGFNNSTLNIINNDLFTENTYGISPK